MDRRIALLFLQRRIPVAFFALGKVKMAPRRRDRDQAALLSGVPLLAAKFSLSHSGSMVSSWTYAVWSIRATAPDMRRQNSVSCANSFRPAEVKE